MKALGTGSIINISSRPGSDRGRQRAAILYTVIQTGRLSDVDLQAWFADVLARLADHPVRRLDELMP